MAGWQALSRPSAAEGGGRRPAFTGLATQPYSATEVDGWQHKLSRVSQNRAAVQFWQARHPPRYAAFNQTSSPRFLHSSPMGGSYRCDLDGLSEQEARARLKSFLAPAAKPSHASFPGSEKA